MSHSPFRHIATLLLLTGVFLLWRPTAVFAATGTFKQINFQGKVVTKTTGVNVADGSYTFVFSLYTVSSAGTNIWTESKSVTVTNGIFQTFLGDTTALPGSVDFNTDNLYLGINFNGDGEMSPRVRFTAVPQAMNALKVAGLTVTDTTGTLTIPNGTTIAFSGANNLTFTTTGLTGVTLPTTGTLSTLAGSEVLTNKTIGSTGLALENSESIANGTDGTIIFGTDETDGAGTIRLPIKTTTGDPALNVEGNMYYNTFDNKFRCYQDTAWTDCVGSGGASTLQATYDFLSGNTITTTTARDIAFTLGEVVTPTSFTLTNQDTAGTTAFSLANSIASGTLTNGILLDQSGAGAMTNAMQVTNSGGNVTTGLLIADTAGGTLTTGLSFTGTIGNEISLANGQTINGGTNNLISISDNGITGVIDFGVALPSTFGMSSTSPFAFGSSANGAGAIQFGASAGGVNITAVGTAGEDILMTANGSSITMNASEAIADAITLNTTDGGIQLNAAGATNGDITLLSTDDTNINGTAGSLINIGTSNVAQVVAIGLATSVDVSITDPNWSITGPGVATFTGMTLNGTLDANSNIITNIGATATDFTTSGSLAIGLDAADANGALMVDNVAQASPIFSAKDNGTVVFQVADGGLLTIDPATTGTIANFALATQWTSGTVLGAAFGGATTQTAAETGLSFDLSTNNTVPNSASGNQTGISLTMKDGGASATARGIVVDGTMDTGMTVGSGTNTITNGLTFGSTGITTDITLQNGETISNDTNGRIALTTASFNAGLDIISGDGTLGINVSTGNAADFTSATSYNFKDQGNSLIYFSLTQPAAANVGTTAEAEMVFNTPVNTSGTNVQNGLLFTPSIGNASAGTNTANVINIGAFTGDAQVTLNGINISGLGAATAATEYGIRIDGTNWDRAISASGTIAFSTLASCDTIDTDINGVLSCGTDSGAGGGAANLQEAYDGDANGSDAIILMTSTDGSIIFQTVAGTQFQVASSEASTVDLQLITNAGFGTVTDGVDGLAIVFTQADDADATDTNAGARISLTSSSGDADTVVGLDITNITGGSATEKGIRIGSGFDQDLEFVDTTPVIRIPDASSLTFQGSQGNTLATFTEYFSGANYGVFEAGGFINIDGSYFQDQFLSAQVAATADVLLASARYGDSFNWILDEAGTQLASVGSVAASTWGCSIRQNTGSIGYVNGVLEVSPDIMSSTQAAGRGADCMVRMGSQTGANTVGILNVANKWVMYWKVKPTSNWTNARTARAMYFGANNFSMPWDGTIPYGTSANPMQQAAAIHMYNGDPTNNNVGSVWAGVVVNGTLSNRSTVPCGQSVVTSAFALLRIEARATNDVGFFVDPDISNGISMTSCGTATTNIPSVMIGPAMNIGNQLLSGQVLQGAWSAQIDLMAFVQDDPRDFSTPAVAAASEPTEIVVPPAPNPINGADLAENYYFAGDHEIGDIVSLGSIPGNATTSAKKYDRKIIGVISESPGLTIGETHESSAPVAITGRVPTKVSSRGGNIEIGDPITTSEVAGVGMRAKDPGKIVGTAMENFTCADAIPCEGKIMVNINVGYYLGDESDTALLVQKDVASIGATLSEPEITALTATASGTLGVNKELTNGLISKFMDLTGGIRVSTMFESIGNAIFRGPSDFLAKVMFKDKVGFENQVTFNNDTAGNAIIKKGQRFVDVSFEKEYDSEPIVNANLIIPRVTDANLLSHIENAECSPTDTIDTCQDKVSNATLAIDVRYAVVSKSKQGFMILLSKETPMDMVFSWSAVAVKDAKTTTSRPSISSGSALLSPISVPTAPTTSPTSAPSPLPVLSPLPTTLPTVAPATQSAAPASTSSAALN